MKTALLSIITITVLNVFTACGGVTTDELFYLHAKVVQSSNDVPIKGLKVTCFKTSPSEDAGVDDAAAQQPSQDPVYTDETGRFEVLEGGYDGKVCPVIVIEDVDGDSNGGSFASLTDNFEDEKIYKLTLN